MVIINGNLEKAEGVSVKEYLEKAGFKIDTIVVELNFEILQREDYETKILKENDTLEVLRFVGGG